MECEYKMVKIEQNQAKKLQHLFPVSTLSHSGQTLMRTDILLFSVALFDT